jgi:phosphotransferase system  glucose/maltose/N-acetylglucosamine-specific IIC component
VLITLLVLGAIAVYAVYVMVLCVAAVFIFLFQMLLEGAQALATKAEESNEKEA